MKLAYFKNKSDAETAEQSNDVDDDSEMSDDDEDDHDQTLQTVYKDGANEIEKVDEDADKSEVLDADMEKLWARSKAQKKQKHWSEKIDVRTYTWTIRYPRSKIL